MTYEYLVVRQVIFFVFLRVGQGAWALALVIGSVCGAEQYQLAVRSFASTLMSSSTSATAPLYMAAMLFSNQVTQQLATVDKVRTYAYLLFLRYKR